MRTLMFVTLLSLCAACSRSHDERGPVVTPVPYAPPAGSPAAPASLPGVHGKSMCQADAECPGARVCRPSDGVSVARYPDRSVIVASRGGSADVRQCSLSAIFFEFDSADLTPEAKEWLDYNADCLKAQALPSLFIEGHADARGDTAYNADLSRRRAESVAAYLSQRGVKTPVTVRPLGAPAVTSWSPGQSERQFAWQRRVELRVQ
jgi:outer membrane protein OmpA-like peptidoglycan-associated protein